MKLIEEGRMAPAGLAHVEAAKKDGRWEKAYVGSADMEIPEDFLTALNKLPRAKKFFATLNKQNLFSIYYRLHSAKKPETRGTHGPNSVNAGERDKAALKTVYADNPLTLTTRQMSLDIRAPKESRSDSRSFLFQGKLADLLLLVAMSTIETIRHEEPSSDRSKLPDVRAERLRL